MFEYISIRELNNKSKAKSLTRINSTTKLITLLTKIQIKDNLVILTYKINTLIALTTFLKKCKKCKGYLDTGTKRVLRSFIKLKQT